MPRSASRESAAFQSILHIDGVGEAAATAFSQFMTAPENRSVVESLLEHITIEPVEEIAADSVVSGKTVVFTGKLERFSRDFGLVGIENGTQLTQIGNRLACSTDAELMPFAVDTWRSDFVF